MVRTSYEECLYICIFIRPNLHISYMIYDMAPTIGIDVFACDPYLSNKNHYSELSLCMVWNITKL